MENRKVKRATIIVARQTAERKPDCKTVAAPVNAGQTAPSMDFEQVKRTFETAHAADPNSDNTAAALLDLSTAVAYSVLNKCIDPQRKTAADRERASNNGHNPALLEVKRGIALDRRLLDNTAAAAAKATKATFTADGDPVTVTADDHAAAALADLLEQTLTDGMDLVQTAALALLEQAADHAAAPCWLDRPYTVRRLSKKVYVQRDDSAAYAYVDTTPIQEVYRAVRKAVQDSRAVQTDPRNGYTYIEDLTADGLDTIYHRLQKWADLGGYASNGQDPNRLAGAPAGFGQGDANYTADRQTVEDYETIVKRLELTDRQAQIVRLRMQGKGTKAIATYLGVTKAAIDIQIYRLREKCEKFGFTPEMWKKITESND